MSNKTQLQTNNASLDGYISRIQAAKEVAATLPEAGGGGNAVEPVIQPLEANENGTYTAPDGVDGYSPVTVNVPSKEPMLQEKTVHENGEVTPDEGYDGLSKVIVEVFEGILDGGGDGTVKYAKITAKPASTTSFTFDNPLGGIAKHVSIKAVSPVITSSRKIHECTLDWPVGLGAVKAYYSSGNVSYVMDATTGTPNNGQFRMTDGSVTVYRFNSATTWSTDCEYEVEIYE